MFKYGVLPGPYFPVFGINTDIYSVNLRIQSEYRKIWIRKNCVFGHFSRSVSHEKWRHPLQLNYFNFHVFNNHIVWDPKDFGFVCCRQACNFTVNTPTQAFSYECCKIFKNNYVCRNAILRHINALFSSSLIAALWTTIIFIWLLSNDRKLRMRMDRICYLN